MSAPARHVVVTGAAGFVGSRLVTRLLAEPALADARFSLNDRTIEALDDPRVRTVPGDFGDAMVRAALIDGRADIVSHLGGDLRAAGTTACAILPRRPGPTPLRRVGEPDESPRLFCSWRATAAGSSPATPSSRIAA